MMPPLLFDLGVPASLFKGLIKHWSADQGALHIRNFPDGETYVRVLSDCAGRDTVVACGLAEPDSKVLPLLFVAQTLADLGARSVGLVAPYLPYMRQDRRFRPGEAVTARYFARILSAHFDWLTTIDPHLHRFSGLEQIYSVPTGVVQAAPEIAAWLRLNVPDPLLIGPDSESEQWVAAVATRADAPSVVLEKLRSGDHEVSISIPQVEAYNHHTPVLIDDIISTGRTMSETLRHLSQTALPPAVCVAVHGLFSDDAYPALLRAGAARVVTCNTVAHETNLIDVSRVLAAARGLVQGPDEALPAGTANGSI